MSSETLELMERMDKVELKKSAGTAMCPIARPDQTIKSVDAKRTQHRGGGRGVLRDGHPGAGALCYQKTDCTAFVPGGGIAGIFKAAEGSGGDDGIWLSGAEFRTYF